jgi:hypothetical protein
VPLVLDRVVEPEEEHHRVSRGSRRDRGAEAIARRALHRAALGVGDGSARQLGPRAQQGGVLLDQRVVAVVVRPAQENDGAVRVRSDQCQLADLGGLEGQPATLVLEQHVSLDSSLQCQRSVCSRVHHLGPELGVPAPRHNYEDTSSQKAR